MGSEALGHGSRLSIEECPIPCSSSSGAESLGIAIGGGDAGRALRALFRSTDTALRSPAEGCTGDSFSRRSEFCLLNVAGRGKPGTTFLDNRRPNPGALGAQGDVGSDFWSGHGDCSSRPIHLLMLNLCHILGFC